MWMVCFVLATRPRPVVGPERPTIKVIRVRRRHAERRDRTILSILVPEQYPDFGLADARRILQHLLEHRLQLAGRAADDLKHFRGRRLLLQRLRQITRARLNFLEQTNILDGDHRLVSKGGGEIDVSLAERLHSFAGNEQHARHNAFADEGHAQHASHADPAREGAKSVFRIALGVIDEHGRIR